MPTSAAPQPWCSIVPDYLMRRLASADEPTVVAAAERSLRADVAMRARREQQDRIIGRLPGIVPQGLRDRARDASTPPRAQQVPTSPDTEPPTARRSLYDAEHRTSLPGRLVRSEGEPATEDISVTEAYDGLGATWGLLIESYGRDSLDGAGLPLTATVHYDKDYDNAFWDGTQMVFGDGDGVYFDSFTSSIDVIGHELAHGLTQYTAGLVYVAQSGALNESLSDVFGSLVKQRSLGQDAEAADWLIGEGLFTDRVNGVALRSMKAPGTAYDDPVLGKDPQPADMDGYVDLPHDSSNDNGGVHINSGIPNRAFYLTATALGGPAWAAAGQIWFDTLVAGGLPRDVDFTGFAKATVAAAKARYGATGVEVAAVREAWRTVKVPLRVTHRNR
ncbi:MAG: M4 family metallopeptidase [Candidatus Lutibacillus vidarii]|nr:M4 family metallopeptidase [Dermatophilaceae bacterium]